MTFCSEWGPAGFAEVSVSRSARPQRLLASTALAVVAFACVWTLYSNLLGNNPIEAAATRGDKLEVAAARGDKLFVAAKARLAAAESAAVSSHTISLLDPHSLGFSPGTFVRNVFAKAVPARPTIETAQASSQAASSAKDAQAAAASAKTHDQVQHDQVQNVAALDLHSQTRAQTDLAAGTIERQPNLLERIFGKLTGRANGPELAYASPDDGLALGGRGVAARYGAQTAVYDISAHAVYLPDGRRLEAHSGYGAYLDDPHHTDIRMRGATPVDVYDLTEREAPFHGVRALRLTPRDESKVFGRSGLLAHTYMLGPNGDSNGCVSFRDYEAFLQAYLNGEVKHLVVVSSL